MESPWNPHSASPAAKPTPVRVLADEASVMGNPAAGFTWNPLAVMVSSAFLSIRQHAQSTPQTAAKRSTRRQEGRKASNWFDLISLLVYCLALSLTVEIDLQ